MTVPITAFAPAGAQAGREAPDPADVCWSTVALDRDPIDLIAFAGTRGQAGTGTNTGTNCIWLHDHAGFAGRGLVARLPSGDAVEYLRAIPAAPGQARDDDGSVPGPVAIGALPFDLSAATAAGASLILPAALLRRDRDGRQWLTTIRPTADSGPPDVSPPRAALRLIGRAIDEAAASTGPRSPDHFELSSPISHDDWCAIVSTATAAIAQGAFRKVVLAREVVVRANRPFAISEVLRRLVLLHPACMVFAVDGFVGASPELLVSRNGRNVRSYPLAGTISRSGDVHTDNALAAALLASPKDRREHAIVVQAVARALMPFCRDLRVPDEPAIVALRNVAHLGTEIVGELGGGEPPSALDLVSALHPTPAVGGTPTAAALAFLADHERMNRGHYAGPVGWVDGSGDGEWAVGIRSAEVDGNQARLFAGVGVVAGSDPEDELVETQLKLQALLAALVRP